MPQERRFRGGEGKETGPSVDALQSRFAWSRQVHAKAASEASPVALSRKPSEVAPESPPRGHSTQTIYGAFPFGRGRFVEPFRWLRACVQLGPFMALALAVQI